MWTWHCCKRGGRPAVAAAGLERVCLQMDVGRWSETWKPAGLAVCGAEAGRAAAVPEGFSAGWGRSGSGSEILIVVQGKKIAEHRGKPAAVAAVVVESYWLKAERAAGSGGGKVQGLRVVALETEALSWGLGREQPGPALGRVSERELPVDLVFQLTSWDYGTWVAKGERMTAGGSWSE